MANRARSKVTRISVESDQTYIRLEIPRSDQPLDGYFGLKHTHPSYNALYSLVLLAAANGYALLIRTRSEITPNAYPEVFYMLIDW